MTTKPMAFALLGVIASLALAGCSGASDRATAYTAAEFWGAYQANNALEVNPARSLEDLYKRSELIVLGSVMDAEAGPSNPVRLDDGTTDENGTTILTVRVDEVLAGPVTKQAKVWISNSSHSVNDASSLLMPADQLVWYLRPSEVPGVMYATARDGIIGSTAEGNLTTVVGSLGEELFPAEITSVRQLADSVAVLEKEAAG